MLKPACLLLLLSVTGVAAAQENIRFEQIDSRAGLSHNSVFSILQDRQGYLWFGTHDGLNRYDGYEFVAYRHQPGDSASLAGNSVFAMLEDDAGHIWVATRGALNRYNPRTNTFTRYRPADATPFVITSMALDAEDHLWLRAESDTMVYQFRPQTETFRRFPIAASGNGVSSVSVDGEGRPWVASASSEKQTQLRVHRLDTTSGRFQPMALPGRYTVQQQWFLPLLYTGPKGVLWIGAWDEGWSEEAQQALRPIPNVGAYVTALCEDQQGRLWIGTDNGLYLFDPTTQNLQHLLLDPSGTSWIANFVRAIYQDEAGTLWVGTNSGLYRYDPFVKPFTFLDPAAYAEAMPKTSPIMALATDERGVMWAGTLGAGLHRIDTALQTTRTYPLARPGGPSGANLIWAIHSESGILWLATSAGMARFDPQTGRATWPAHGSGVMLTVQRGLHPTTLIAGGEQIVHIDPATGTVQPLLDSATQQPTRFPPSEAVLVDPLRRTLWLASAAGLFQHDLETNQTKPIPEVWEAIPNMAIWSLHQDAGGSLWLGTDAGLARFDPTTATLATFPDFAWPGSVVYSMLEDDQHRLWLGTSKGLVRFDPGTETFRHFDAGDGIGNTEFNRRAALRLPNGHLAFGGLDGITVFDAAAIEENPFAPPVVITRAQKANQDGTTAVHLAPDQTLTLTYEDKSFALEYAALSYTNPSKNQYRYRLDGFEDTWIEAGTRRRANYTNIPPGQYVFRVQGSNNDGLWNEAGVALPIVIQPPFWQTWWFRLVAAIGVLSVLYAGYRYRVQHLLGVERLRLRIAGDLHDDIGSKLSGMALMSEMLEADSQIPEGPKEDLREIGTSAREIIGDLRDIVWFIDPDHDQAGKTVEKMQQTARRLLNGTAYTFDVATNEQLEEASMGFRRNLFLIYKEALHNVARHAYANNVHIHLSVQRRQINLTISDDGIGFVCGEAAGGSGLKNIQRRTEEIGGSVTVTSTPGRGTQIDLTAPLP